MSPRLLATISVLLLCLSTLARAQAPSGEISGVVTDPSGAPMPGVTITLTNQSTNAVRELQTNESGLYVMPAIQPGVYTLKATLSGFRTLERRDVTVQVGSASRIPITLEVGQLTEVVEITGGAPLLQIVELGGRHRHREPGHRRAAAQRTQLPAARLAHSGRHHQRSLVEPGQAADGRATQQLRAERRRAAHPLQPLLPRRDREHRPELQLLHAAAVGGRAAGVQRPLRPVRRRVRAGDRADQRLDQVGHQSVPRHGVRVRAPFVARREELLRSRRPPDSPVQAQPVRRDARRPGRHPQAAERPRPALLHVQLGRPARDQVADGDAVGTAHRLARRRLLEPARRQRQPGAHLRPGDARVRRRRQRAPGPDALPRQPDPGQPHPSGVARAASSTGRWRSRSGPAPTTSTTSRAASTRTSTPTVWTSPRAATRAGSSATASRKSSATTRSPSRTWEATPTPTCSRSRSASPGCSARTS